MQIRFRHLDVEADRAQQARDKFLRALHPGREIRVGRDALMANELFQFFNRVEHPSTVAQNFRARQPD